MQQTAPTAFVIYSQDSDEHREWVRYLVDRLRTAGGVDASFDLYETQVGTVNLNAMMIRALKDYDYVIIVLTEKYAARADELKGRVGFETMLSFPVLRENPDKIILVAREDVDKALPFHLKGQYALDFTKDEEFDSIFSQLLHRIYRKPMYEKPPVGKIPDLISSGISKMNTSPSKSRELEIDHDEECIVWLLPRGFLLINDIAYRDDPNWNVKAGFWNYDGELIYGVHYKPEYHESWRDYEMRFRTLQIPRADWHLDEYYFALRFIQKLREREEQDELEILVKEQLTYGHHVSCYAPGIPIHLPEVPDDFNVYFETGELRDIQYELKSLRDGNLYNPDKLVNRADALRHELLASAQEYFGDSHLSFKAISDVAKDFDSASTNKKMKLWLDRAVTVLETTLDRVLRKAARY